MSAATSLTKPERKQRRQDQRRKWAREAHPFFWLMCVLLVPAIAAAGWAGGGAPGYALGSAWLYRLQVGGAFFAGEFLLSMLLWLAYSGRSFGDLQLPGGAGVSIPPPDPDLDDAADGLAGYKTKTDERIGKLEESLAAMIEDDDPSAPADETADA